VAQTLYSRGFAWKQAGLQLQGRSFSLRRNFRNTRQIAEAAAVLSANNRVLKMSEEFVDPEFTQRQGPWPIVLECDVTDREHSAVSEKILSLVEDQQFRLADFAILCPTLELCDASRQTLHRVQVPCVVHTEDEFDVLEEQVKILTIHSAKGLEFPVVFLLGLHADTLPRRIYQVDDEEALLELERDRTLMYVGMTRAAEALYLVTSQQAPSRFLSEVEKVIRVEPFVGGKV
jgi:superfamily I DNA/RNA helicase